MKLYVLVLSLSDDQIVFVLGPSCLGAEFILGLSCPGADLTWDDLVWGRTDCKPIPYSIFSDEARERALLLAADRKMLMLSAIFSASYMSCYYEFNRMPLF